MIMAGDMFPIVHPQDEDGLVYLGEEDKARFKCERDGDHLMVPFQCDLCHFRNLKGTNPEESDVRDQNLLVHIRRAVLDSFWSREPGTVNGNRLEIVRGAMYARELGLGDQLLGNIQPFPLKECKAMTLAVTTLRRSLDAGKNAPTIQFGTMRKLRTAVGNLWHATPAGQADVVMARATTKSTITSSPSYSTWFERFMQGSHKRMGDVVKPDLAVSVEVMVEIQRLLEESWNAATTQIDRSRITDCACFLLAQYTGALRGEEVPKLDLGGLRKHLKEGLGNKRRPHVPLTLLGRFKSEIGERYHIIPVATVTSSGLNPGRWFERLVQDRMDRGVTAGPVFRKIGGEQARASDFEDSFHLLLQQVKDTDIGLIAESVVVTEEYGISRSCRRGATTRARVAGVTPEDIDLNNRWRKVENSKGRAPVFGAMRDHYTEISQMLGPLLRFSEAL